jgi:hypothetical protein
MKKYYIESRSKGKFYIRKRRKAKSVLSRNFLLKHISEGKIDGKIEVTLRREERLLDVL